MTGALQRFLRRHEVQCGDCDRPAICRVIAPGSRPCDPRRLTDEAIARELTRQLNEQQGTPHTVWVVTVETVRKMRRSYPIDSLTRQGPHGVHLGRGDVEYCAGEHPPDECPRVKELQARWMGGAPLPERPPLGPDFGDW